jgi:hypothetical protein
VGVKRIGMEADCADRIMVTSSYETSTRPSIYSSSQFSIMP